MSENNTNNYQNIESAVNLDIASSPSPAQGSSWKRAFGLLLLVACALVGVMAMSNSFNNSLVRTKSHMKLDEAEDSTDDLITVYVDDDIVSTDDTTTDASGIVSSSAVDGATSYTVYYSPSKAGVVYASLFSASTGTCTDCDFCLVYHASAVSAKIVSYNTKVSVVQIFSDSSCATVVAKVGLQTSWASFTSSDSGTSYSKIA